MDLDGKVAIVTGASRGVGAATALALAEAGCVVACAARSTAARPQRTPGTLDETVAAIRELGGSAIAVPTDLSEPADITAMVERTVAELGGLDVLINNAAVTFAGDLDQLLRRHQLTMAINYWAPFFAIQQAAPHMARRGGGGIINVSSYAALVTLPNMLSYGSSKLALEHLTLDAARVLRADRTAVNCFRIDVPVLAEGSIANQPEADLSVWEPAAVAAEGMVWMLRQPASYTGRRESMFHLRAREGIMTSRSERPYQGATPRVDVLDALDG